MSLIFATQLTAVATLALAALALATAILALLAWRKQSREVRDQGEMLRVQSEQLAEDRKVNVEQVRVLALQAEELRQATVDREREALERRRAQAVQVYVWITYHHPKLEGLAAEEISKAGPSSPEVTAHVRNTSPQPIYDLNYEWRGYDLESGYYGIAVLPDAEACDTVCPQPEVALRVTAVVTFRDRAGVWWRAQPNGRLEELPAPGSGHGSPDDGAPAGEMAPDVGQ